MNETFTPGFTLASRKRRIAALLIDHFVMTSLILSIVFMALGPDIMNANSAGKMSVIMLGVMLPGFFFYLAKDSFQGISLGKWVMGIMIRDESNPVVTPSFGRLLVRNLFLVIWPVEFIALAVSDEKKRLGDKAAKTIVVKNPTKSAKAIRVTVLATAIVAFVAFTFIFISVSIKSSDAYKVSVREIGTDKDILIETGGVKGFGMIPSGNISVTNGQGQAQLNITVVGEKKDLDVQVYLEKEPQGEWKLINLEKK